MEEISMGKIYMGKVSMGDLGIAACRPKQISPAAHQREKGCRARLALK